MKDQRINLRILSRVCCIIFMLCLVGCKTKNLNPATNMNEISTQVNNQTNEDSIYTIKKISVEGHAFIIDIVKSDRAYRLLSKPSVFTDVFCKNKIEEGKSYKLALEQYYPPIDRDSNGIYYERAAVDFNNSTVRLRGFTDTLYITNSLDGLCLNK